MRNFRSDSACEAAIAYLQAQTDARFSEIVRNSLIDMADAHRRDAMRAEAEAMRDDPAYQAEIAEVTEILDAISAW